MQKLLTYINSLTGFSSESWDALQPVLSKKVYAEGDYLLREGEICNSLFFIDEGFARTYHVFEGDEKDIAFHFDGEMTTSIGSFGTGQPSQYSIQACTDVTAIVFDKQKLLEATLSVPQIGVFGKNSLKYMASKFEEYSNMFNFYTPTERYAYLGRHKPDLLNKIPSGYVASYIGVAREALNKIRNRKFLARI